MRLIDADDLISELASFREKQEDPKNKDIATTVSLFVEIYARTTPPIDISVVRCKDCKHYVIHVLFGHRQGWCERLCDEFDKSLARGTGDDDFCSRGERRSE